jgi:hypothetical protein
MAILRCTKKLLNELKIKSPAETNDTSELGSWHANLLRIDRRKCVLFTHDTTLYSFLVPGLRKPQFQNFRDVFGQNLFKRLRLENFSQEYIEVVLDEHLDISISKTNNRSVLGSMNDLAYQIRYKISSGGGLNYMDLDKMNHYLNRIPMGAIEETYSIDALSNLTHRLST